jgi:hypothetical protein
MMKLTIMTILLGPMLAFGQRTMSDFMDENCDVIWFGLDFTKARMIGSEGFNDPVAIKEDYFRKWNHLMISEGDKYEWGKALLVTDLKYDYGVVDVVNDEVKVKSLVINKSYSITEEDIHAAVRAYKIEYYKDGIGVVIVVESFDKIKEQAFGYITFFDVATKKVLYKHKLVGEAGGFGFRNYWAGAIHNWLKYTKSRVMKDMKKEFQ